MKWEGRITGVADGRFWGSLMGEDGSHVEGDFPIARVVEKDRELVVEGQMFTLEVDRDVFIMRMDRQPPWTKKEIAAARREAKKMAKFFKVE